MQIKMTGKLSGACLLALALGLPGGAPLAQSVDRNPFAPPPPETRIEAAERDRILEITSDVVRSEMNRLERSVTETVERRLIDRFDRQMQTYRTDFEAIVEERALASDAALETLKAEIPEMIGAAIETQKSSTGSAGGATLPDGTVFVACVNGKALYRDQTGNTFYSEDLDAASGAADCGN
jgi:phosphohistidine swiveling domain-containing protein